MEIDFRLQRQEEVTSGLVMSLVPHLSDGGLAEQEAIFIGEDAFGFVEPCISGAWPKYLNYGHWGRSEIPIDVWRHVVDALHALQKSLLEATVSGDVSGIGFIFDDLRIEFEQNFSELRGGITGMISELISWLERKIPSCSHIMVIGI